MSNYESIYNVLSHYSLKNKIAALILFMFGGIIFWNLSYLHVNYNDIHENKDAQVKTKNIETLFKAVRALENERYLAINFIHHTTTLETYQESIKISDGVIKEVQNSKQIDIQHLQKRLKTLTELRDSVKKGNGDAIENIRFYTDALVKHAIDMIVMMAQNIDTKPILAFSNLLRALEYTALERDLTYISVKENSLDVQKFEQLSVQNAKAQTYLDQFKLYSKKEELPRLFKFYSSSAFISINQIKESIINSLQDSNVLLDMDQWNSSMELYIFALNSELKLQYQATNEQLANQLIALENDFRIDIIFLIFPLLLSFMIAFLIYTDMRNALNTLTKFIRSKLKKESKEYELLIESRSELGNVFKSLVSFRKKIDEQIKIIKHNYEYDTLTGLPNRNKLLSTLDSFSPNDQFTLIYIDIVNFSHINDSFGQAAGDSYLKVSADVLSDIVDSVAITEEDKVFSVFRMGSDEFVILCSHERRLKQIIDKLCKTFFVQFDQIELPLSFIFGLSRSTEGATQSSILSQAEIASRYALKHKKYYEYYNKNASLERLHLENLEWVKRIANAFDNGDFMIHFQPIMSTSEAKVVKYEVLIRMIDQSSGRIISPVEFIEVLQNSGHEKELTKLIIDQSFKSYKMCGVDLSINMTKDDLDYDMLDYLKNSIIKYDIPAKNIAIELVESEELLKEEYIDIIHTIKQLGFKIAIDDFGTGYSNFSYLTVIKPDYIKIDGSLIKDLSTDSQSRKVVESIFDFAQALGIETIAEYVSDEKIYNIIKSIGIEYAQGYFIGGVESCEQIKQRQEN